MDLIIHTYFRKPYEPIFYNIQLMGLIPKLVMRSSDLHLIIRLMYEKF
jgi:hypothetical protein